MIVVSNSSPLITLARAGLLKLLRDLFKRVLIPQEVLYETTEKGKGKPGEKEIRKASWIEVVSLKDKNLLKKYAKMLDPEDAMVIALANERKADLLIVDDKELREFAEKEGLPITGTIGILIRAKKKGLISNVKVEMDKLLKAGLRLNDELYRKALKEAKE